MIRRWLHRRRLRAENKNRNIFTYVASGEKRYADPMAIALALKFDKRYTEQHLQQAKNLDPASMEIVAQAAERAFGIPRLDESTGEGLTISELIGLVDAFDLWCFQLQKKTAHLAT